MWLVVKNSIFYNNYERDNSKGISVVVYR